MIDFILVLLSATPVNIEKCTYSTSDAEYNYSTNKITLCKGKKFTQKSLIHETGHVFWFQKLTRKERANYTKLYNYCSKINCFPSEYAMTNKEESFAEDFLSLYTTKKYKISLDKVSNPVRRAKLKYINYLIKKYEQK